MPVVEGGYAAGGAPLATAGELGVAGARDANSGGGDAAGQAGSELAGAAGAGGAGTRCAQGALSFSGAQFVQVPGTETLQLQTALTLEAWLRTASSVAIESIFMGKHSCGTDNGYFLEIYSTSSDGAHTPNAPAFYVGANTNHVYGTTSIVDGQWHHVAGTWDGQTSKLYVDGVFVGSKATSYKNTNGLDFSLGAVTNGTCRAYTGVLDEVSVWSVVRTEAQIAADAAAPLDANAAGLELYFDFNAAGCSKTLTDRSPHHRDGLLGGTVELSPSDPTWVDDGPF